MKYSNIQKGLLILIAVVNVSLLTFTSCKQKAEITEPLASKAQLKADSLYIELSKDPQILKAEEDVLAKFQSDSLYQVEDAKKSAKQAVHYLALSAIESTILELAVSPQFIWLDHAARNWHGLDVPASKWGLDNPDNVYRGAALDSSLTYEIHVHHAGKAPIQESFDVSSISTNPDKLGKQLAFIEIRNLKTDSLGDYVVTASSKPDSTNKNHIQLTAPKVNVTYRNTHSDWTVQTPAFIDVKIVGGEKPAKEPTKAELVSTAITSFKKLATILLQGKNLWAGYSGHVNHLSAPWKRDGGWGYAIGGHFSLAKDEAYVIKVNPKTARYVGFQLADPWLASFDYVNYSSSLNNTQATPDKEGNYTYVISATDPGVHNWLDTRGYLAGTLLIRWQYLENLSFKNIDDAILIQKVVKLADLSTFLPKDTEKVSPEDRKKILEDRAKSYNRRLVF